MSVGGNKPFSFVSGVLLGMLAAIGLVFLVFNDFNPLNLITDKTIYSSNDTLVDLRETRGNESKKGKKNKLPLPKEIVAETTDSFARENDTSTVKISPIDGDIIVRRDELIESKIVELIFLDGKPKSVKSDSLLKTLENTGIEKSQFKIEFWKSPINYKGFKMIRNNIIAFGLETGESSKLYSYEQQYYFKQGGSVYKIYQTSDFESFSKVTDDSILKLMR